MTYQILSLDNHKDNRSFQPKYSQDYVCNNIFLSDVTNSYFVAPPKSPNVSFTDLSFSNQAIVHSGSSIIESTTYAEVSTHPGWVEAMDRELEALKSNHT